MAAGDVPVGVGTPLVKGTSEPELALGKAGGESSDPGSGVAVAFCGFRTLRAVSACPKSQHNKTTLDSVARAYLSMTCTTPLATSVSGTATWAELTKTSSSTTVMVRLPPAMVCSVVFISMLL